MPAKESSAPSPLIRFNISLDKRESSLGRARKSLTLFPGASPPFTNYCNKSNYRDERQYPPLLRPRGIRGIRAHVLKQCLPTPPAQLVIPPTSSGWSRSSLTDRKNVTLLRRHMARIRELKRVTATVLLYVADWILTKWPEPRLRTRKYVHAWMHLY